LPRRPLPGQHTARRLCRHTHFADPELEAPAEVIRVIRRLLTSCPHEATLNVMSAVGLRELKNQLSKYVQRAKSGETVLITYRGHVVAELNPPKKISPTGEPTTTLDELRRKGLLYGG